MGFLDDIWKEEFEDDPKGYEEHLEKQRKRKEEMEEAEYTERKVVANLLLQPTKENLNAIIQQLSNEELLTIHYQLERTKDLIEERYHEKLEEEVFLISTTTFSEVIKRNEWAEVKKVFLELFNEQEESIDAYEKVFYELQTLTPEENEEGYVVSLRPEMEDGAMYFDVVGQKRGDLLSYALDFNTWQDWLGFYCNAKTLQTEGELVFVSCCLWELTFDGFEQVQIQASIDEIKRRIDEAENLDRP